MKHRLASEQLPEMSPAAGQSSTAGGVFRARVLDLREDGEIVVAATAYPASPLQCDFLESSANEGCRLEIGDEVVVLVDHKAGPRGCVLGRVGRYGRSPDEGTQPREHVVIEANETLTLRCGQSSLQLRKDGKLRILGRDVLSRAKRMLRIKGASVSIN